MLDIGSSKIVPTLPYLSNGGQLIEMERCRYLLGRWVCRHGMIDQLIYQYLRMCVPSFRAREGYRLTVSEVHVLGTSLSLYLYTS